MRSYTVDIENVESGVKTPDIYDILMLFSAPDRALFFFSCGFVCVEVQAAVHRISGYSRDSPWGEGQ